MSLRARRHLLLRHGSTAAGRIARLQRYADHAMSTITYIIGAKPDASIEQVLAALASQPAWQPFDPRAVAFVARLSQRLLTSPGIRQHPELAALAHWFRGANLRTLAGKYP